MASLTLLVLPLLLTCLILVESQMYDSLFSRLTGQYESRGSKHTIPAASERDVVHVNISMSLIQIQSLDTKTGDAVLEAWMGYYWRDGRLRWKPAKYDNIRQLHIPPSFIWKPDIVLYNGHVESEGYNAVLEHDGNLMFIPETTIMTRCNISSYTADGTVTCVMKFGSWTYNGHLISPRVAAGSILSDYVNGSLPGWDVVSASAERRVKYYSCCPEPYPQVIFTLVFRQEVSSWMDYI